MEEKQEISFTYLRLHDLTKCINRLDYDDNDNKTTMACKAKKDNASVDDDTSDDDVDKKAVRPVVRAVVFQRSGIPGLKTHSDHSLNLFLVLTFRMLQHTSSEVTVEQIQI